MQPNLTIINMPDIRLVRPSQLPFDGLQFKSVTTLNFNLVPDFILQVFWDTSIISVNLPS